MTANWSTYINSFHLALLLVLFLGSNAHSQQILCVADDAVQYYSVDTEENNGEGTLDSRYNWRILESTFNGTIKSVNTPGNQIAIDWQQTPIGSYTLEVQELSVLGCSAKKYMSIQIQEQPLLKIVATDILCENDLLDLRAEIGGSASQVNWSSTGDGTFNMSVGNEVRYQLGPQDIANGQVVIKAISDDPSGDFGCPPASTEKQVTILALEDPIFSISTNYCYADVVPELPNISDNNITGHWSAKKVNTKKNGRAEYFFTPDNRCAKNYVLSVFVDPCGCVFDQKEEINLCLGDDALIVGSETIEINEVGQIKREFLESIPDDCDVRTTMVINVFAPLLPNAFSPNATFGLNDTFHLLTDRCPVENVTLSIFNRWGEKVFESTDVRTGWNGKDINGEDIAAGSYIWSLKYTYNGKLFNQNGTIQIVH